MKLWRREPTPEEELDERRDAAAVTLQRWTRGIKWRKTHAKDVRALAALRRFQQTTRQREAALVEVTPLRRSAGLVASAVGAAAGFVASSGDTTIAAATAASLAAFTERQGENERHKQTQQLTASLQRDAINQDRLLHRDSLRADQELHRRSIHVDKVYCTVHKSNFAALLTAQSWRARHRRVLHPTHRLICAQVLHLKTILTDLLEADKEADRDLWEQRTERFQTLMTVSGLLFAGAFALAVEGDLPREARDDCAFGSGSDCLKLVTLHYSLLASAFGLHLCVISGCLCITRLFGAVWKSNFRRQTPWTRCGLRSCVYSMAWRFTLTG